MSKTYGGDLGLDDAYSVIKTIDGGYALAGFTNSSGAGNYDGWLVKVDSVGNAQWNKTYGGASADDLYVVFQTSDGGYVLVGYTTSFGAGKADSHFIKVDSSGNGATTAFGAWTIGAAPTGPMEATSAIRRMT